MAIKDITYPFTLVFENDFYPEFELHVKIDHHKPLSDIDDDFNELMEEADENANTAEIELTYYTLKKILMGGAIIAEFH